MRIFKTVGSRLFKILDQLNKHVKTTSILQEITPIFRISGVRSIIIRLEN